MDRFAEFAIIAAREAVRDAALEFTPEMKSGGAVITGSCVGGQTSEDKEFEGLYRRDRNRVSSADDSSHHGERRRQPDLDGDGLHWTRLHALDGMFVSGPCHGTCLLDGAIGGRADRHHRRQRSAIQPRPVEGLGGDARGFSDHMPAVLS